MANNFAPTLMKLTKGHRMQGLVNQIIMPLLRVDKPKGLIADYTYVTFRLSMRLNLKKAARVKSVRNPAYRLLFR